MQHHSGINYHCEWSALESRSPNLLHYEQPKCDPQSLEPCCSQLCSDLLGHFGECQMRHLPVCQPILIEGLGSMSCLGEDQGQSWYSRTVDLSEIRDMSCVGRYFTRAIRPGISIHTALKAPSIAIAGHKRARTYRGKQERKKGRKSVKRCIVKIARL